jgi:surfactin synthase thioesterase subunit
MTGSPAPKTSAVYDDTAQAWMRRFDHSEQPAARVVLLPHAGGSAQFLRTLAGALSRHFDTVVVQYPHRLDRRHEPPARTVEELAAQVSRLVPRDDDLPLVLFGHSLGALVAYEACLQLATSTDVAGLVASACREPLEAAKLRNPPTDEALLAEVREMGGTDARVWDEPELVDLFLPPLRADFAALDAYDRTERARVDCPILSLVGADDVRVRPQQAEGWRDYTGGSFRQSVLPGGHFFVVEHCDLVVQQLLELEVAR